MSHRGRETEGAGSLQDVTTELFTTEWFTSSECTGDEEDEDDVCGVVCLSARLTETFTGCGVAV